MSLLNQKQNKRTSAIIITGEVHVIGEDEANVVYLDEVPLAGSVVIAGFTETTIVTPASGEYRVNYTGGKVTFNAAENEDEISVNYVGLGSFVQARDINRIHNHLDRYLFDIVDRGAVGNNVKINTSIIQDTIDELISLGGGTLFVPRGTFLSGELFLGNNIRFHIGAGGTLKHRPGIAARPLLSNDLVNGNENITVDGDGTFDGNASEVLATISDAQLFRFGGVSNLRINGPKFRNTAYEAIMSANATKLNRISDCSFTLIGNSALSGAGNVLDCINISPNALSIYNVAIVLNTFYNCPGIVGNPNSEGASAVLVEANPGTPLRIHSVTVTGNTIDTMGGNGIRMMGVTDGTVGNNVMRNVCLTRGTALEILYSSLVANNNRMRVPDGARVTAGVGMRIGEGCFDVEANGNSIIQEGPNTALLVEGNCDDVTLDGNRIRVSKNNANARPVYIGAGAGVQNRIHVRRTRIISSVGVEFVAVGGICVDAEVSDTHIYTTVAGEVKVVTGATNTLWFRNTYRGAVTENFAAGTMLLKSGTVAISAANVPTKVIEPLYGTGSPEGVVTAPIGTMYLRTDGGASTTLYIKESGTGNTGWVAK